MAFFTSESLHHHSRARRVLSPFHNVQLRTRRGLTLYKVYDNRVQKRWRHKNFVCISAFWIPCLGGAWWKTSTAQIWWESVHGGPEICPHEYLLSPIEISVNWPGSNSYEPGQLFTLISMGLIRYSCGHILGHHEPIHVKFGVWRFFIMLYRNMVMKMLKCKQIFLMTSHFGTL